MIRLICSDYEFDLSGVYRVKPEVYLLILIDSGILLLNTITFIDVNQHVREKKFYIFKQVVTNTISHLPITQFIGNKRMNTVDKLHSSILNIFISLNNKKLHIYTSSVFVISSECGIQSKFPIDLHIAAERTRFMFMFNESFIML